MCCDICSTAPQTVIPLPTFSRKRSLAVAARAAVFAVGLLAQDLRPTMAAESGGTQPREFPVQPAGGLNSLAPRPGDTGNIRASYTDNRQPHALSAPVEKAIPLSPLQHTSSALEKSSGAPRTLGAIVTVAISLAVVLGLFWLCAWLMRRGMPSNAKRLPNEVVEVLGRAPLAGRQQMHVLRFGNKLLLVCASPSGVDTIGEITDPVEIDRLAGMCETQQSQSATAAFKQIFGQLASDRSLKTTPIGKLASRKEVADV